MDFLHGFTFNQREAGLKAPPDAFQKISLARNDKALRKLNLG
jgi:hypothetical protein